MAQVQNMPIALTRDELATVLADMLKGVESGDTCEGSIQFLAPSPTMGEPIDADYMVMASYRTGNLNGQGGLRLLGTLTEQVTPRELLGMDNDGT